MAQKIADIAKSALDAVQSAITDATGTATLTYTVNPDPASPNSSYDAVRGEFADSEATATGRAVIETTKPVTDIFPDYTPGSGDELVFLEGFTAVEPGWKLTFSGSDWHIKRVQDILGAGTMFYVVARKVMT